MYLLPNILRADLHRRGCIWSPSKHEFYNIGAKIVESGQIICNLRFTVLPRFFYLTKMPRLYEYLLQCHGFDRCCFWNQPGLGGTDGGPGSPYAHAVCGHDWLLVTVSAQFNLQRRSQNSPRTLGRAVSFVHSPSSLLRCPKNDSWMSHHLLLIFKRLTN